MRDLTEMDFTSTIREYEYTKRAMQNMNRVMDSDKFKDMDSEAIFDYLMNEMEVVSFGDYLKRYIFEKAEINDPFAEITDDIYTDIIIDSFTEKGVPFSLTSTSRKKKAIVKAWLGKGNSSRDSVFALGFGLSMSVEEVSEFLTKVIKEEDFDFGDIRETVFWHCFYKKKSYAKAKAILEYYEEVEECAEVNEGLLNAMRSNPRVYLANEQELKEYMVMIKSYGIPEKREKKRIDEFISLYEKACEIIDGLYHLSEKGSKVTAADVEKVICSGMPLTDSGNLKKMSLSLLSSHFQNKRLTRQRIDEVIKGKRAIDRFDYITLLFFIYAETVEPGWPVERTIEFIEEINDILHRCDMGEIYPVNPYEAFVIMCMLTEYPLAAFAEVWEKSYDNERE